MIFFSEIYHQSKIRIDGIQNIPLEESKGEPNHLRELRESFKKHYAKKKKEEEDSKFIAKYTIIFSR